MTLQYNILQGQPERSIRLSRLSSWGLGGAIAASIALHGLVAGVAIALMTPSAGAPDEAAITIFVDPARPPVASAMETPRPPAPEPPQEVAPQEPPQESAAAPAPPPEPALQEVVPPPPTYDSLALPDFKPPPKPAAPKVEPKRVAPASPPAARATPAPAAAAPPAQAMPSPAPNPGPPAATAAVTPGWNALLAAWLAAHRTYPDESRRRSEEGEVTVRFTVAADGRVSDAAVVKGSGFAALDAAALSMLRGASLPPPGAEATRTVRIRYRLND